jgi:hypothetical protein
LIIQGLREIGEKNITSGIKSELKKIIKKSGESEAIKKEIKNAPVWIQKITKQMIREIER